MPLSIAEHDAKELYDNYDLGKELGRGQFGVTFKASHKKESKVFACKTISKRKLVTKEDSEDVRREVAIMHHLNGHENIVSLQASYEDKHSVHLLMELCEGGELFDRIVSKGRYSEKAAAAAFRTVMRVVAQCHALGVMHRDLKPENFLLSSKHDDAAIKGDNFNFTI
mmetsp:Transcript_23208/g.44298  ORF Transcript_23208/g.44298 Transcript_23208/m.44298 type:complete len:168 (+) Transcript_23208:151-654(+)